MTEEQQSNVPQVETQTIAPKAEEQNVGRILKFVVGGLEALMGIPVLGGALVLSLAWTPLVIALILHIVTLIFSKQENRPITGNVLGIVTSCIAFIPIVGMIMHIITAIIVLIEAATDKKVQA